MSTRAEIRDFLVTRRARLTPQAAGLQSAGGHRRVPGLRREEVAALAGVSVDYYTRLERGDAPGMSDAVLDGLVTALALDDAERAYLVALLRSTSSARRPRPLQAARTISPTTQRVLDSLTSAPAFVSNCRLDLLGTNTLCAALYADLAEPSGGPVNLARYTFLDARASDFYPEWAHVADMSVALLRSSAARDPFDEELSHLIGQLASGSDEFRARWAAHHVQQHTSGIKHFHHPVVGDLELAFDSMTLAADTTLTMTVYTAEPGSSTAQSLEIRGSWAA